MYYSSEQPIVYILKVLHIRCVKIVYIILQKLSNK